MSREIKFREWDSEREELHGNGMGMSYGKREDYDDSIAFRFAHEEGGERILMQYAGEDDLELHPIYEGDIVRIYSEEPHMTVDMLDVVIFKNGCFTTKEHEYDFYHCGGDCLTVKGNIYENPELLEESNADT